MSFVPVGIDENSDLPQEVRDRLTETIALRPGGTAGQALRKDSGTDFDVSWGTVHEVPASGTTGQALVKDSGTDYDVEWGDVVLSDGAITLIVAISRTAYDALTPPVSTTLYVIDEAS